MNDDFTEQARQLVKQWLESMPRSPAGTMIAATVILLATIVALAFVGGVMVVSACALVATVKAAVSHR